MAEKKTKLDLVNHTYEALSAQKIEKSIVKRVADQLFLEIKENLSKGNPIEIRGIGTFDFKYRQKKGNARNPQTGEKLEISGHSVVYFKPGYEIKQAVWDTKHGIKL